MEDDIHEDYKETSSQQQTVPCAVALTEMTSNLDGQDHDSDRKRHQEEECCGTNPDGVRVADRRWIRRVLERGNQNDGDKADSRKNRGEQPRLRDADAPISKGEG